MDSSKFSKESEFKTAVDKLKTLTQSNSGLDLELKENIKIYSELIKIIWFHGCLNLKSEPESYLTTEDYKHYSSKANSGLECYELFVGQLLETKLNTNSIELVLPIVLLCLMHYEEYPWTNESTVKNAHAILGKLYEIMSCKNISEFLSWESDGFIMAGLIFNEMKPFLTKETWKTNPSSSVIFKSILVKISFNHLKILFPSIFPPILLFIDDHQLEYHLTGVHCANYLIDNIPSVVMKQNGRADVLYDALKRLSATKEPQVVIPLYSCLLKLLPIIEPEPNRKTIIKCTLQDELFSSFLLNAETEGRADLKFAYAVLLNAFIIKLGTHTIKHLRRILNLVQEYLQSFGDTNGTIKTNILTALNSLIKITWPRISPYCEQIMKCLLIMLYHISTDNKRSSLSPKVEEDIRQECFQCFLQLSRACPQQFEELGASLSAMGNQHPFLGIFDDVKNKIDQIC